MSDQLTQLHESVNLGGGKVDRENATISGVKILGRQSANGREYSDQAMSDAVKCYENIGTNIDHDRSGKERSMLSCNGWLSECVQKPDGVYAKVNLLKSHPLTETIMEIAEKNPNRIGMSHDAMGKEKMISGRRIVESIQSVKSVDFVQNPATNKGLFESEDSPVSKKKFSEFVEAIAGDTAEKKALTSLIESDEKIGSIEIEEAEFNSPLFKAMQAALVESANALAKAGEKKPDATIEGLQARLDAYEAKDGARKLLESAGVTATEAKISAVAALGSKAEKDALVKEFKESVQVQPRKPNSGSVLHESQGGNQSYEEMTKGGFAKAL